MGLAPHGTALLCEERQDEWHSLSHLDGLTQRLETRIVYREPALDLLVHDRQSDRARRAELAVEKERERRMRGRVERGRATDETDLRAGERAK